MPYKGSAPGQEAALAGEVALVVTSLAEQAPLIEGGQLKPLGDADAGDDAQIAGMTVPSAFGIYGGLDQVPAAETGDWVCGAQLCRR